MLQRISFRLGMEGGLYLGIGLGALTSALLILGYIFLLSPGMPDIIILAVALALASVAGIATVVWAKQTRSSSDAKLCTCRYRSSLYTWCRECALKEQPAGTGRPEQ